MVSQQYEKYCEKYAYSTQQKMQLKKADDEGLDLSYMCDPRYDWEQMKEIRLCLSQGIDPTPFCHPDIPSEQMKGMRQGLFENNAVYDAKHELVQKKRLLRYIIVTVFIAMIVSVSALCFWKKDTITNMFQSIHLELKTDNLSIGESKAESIDYMDYIKSYSRDCHLTIPKTKLDKMGTYRVKYVLSNDMKKIEKYMIIRVYDDVPPVLSISKTDESIAYGSSFNSESYIQSAVDNENGDIKDRVKTEGSVDCSKSGTYKIRYYVEDDAGNVTEKFLNVSVAEKPQQTLTPSVGQQSASNNSQQSNPPKTGGSSSSRKVTASSRVFNFSSSSDMNQTYNQAVQYAQSQINAGHANGYNVVPIQGADGIYTGYRVTFS